MKDNERKEYLSNLYFEAYNKKPANFFMSPGRIEVLGNHTDHNNGKVLVSAINQNILAAASKENDNFFRLKSIGYPMIEIDLNDLTEKENEFTNSASLVRGVLYKLKELGYKIGGASVITHSTIFKGAGLSSSAAFEILISEIENYYYNNDSIGRVEMAKIGQYSENVYFHKPCGLLDQMGISLGGFNYIDFKDTKNPLINNFKFNLEGYEIVLVNTGGNHTGLTNYYANLKNDMKKVASYFNKDVLREVSKEDFYNSMKELNKKVGGRAILRAIHYFKENERVDLAYKALNEGNTDLFLKMINESGESSYKLLQNCKIDNDKKQGITLALELTKEYLNGSGATRVHGGGFKGTIITYCPKKELKGYVKMMKHVFGRNNVIVTTLCPTGTVCIE